MKQANAKIFVDTNSFDIKNFNDQKKNFMKTMSFVAWKEKEEFVAQCLNVDVSSYGPTLDEAIKNLKEAVELYFQDENDEICQKLNPFS